MRCGRNNPTHNSNWSRKNGQMPWNILSDRCLEVWQPKYKRNNWWKIMHTRGGDAAMMRSGPVVNYSVHIQCYITHVHFFIIYKSFIHISVILLYKKKKKKSFLKQTQIFDFIFYIILYSCWNREGKKKLQLVHISWHLLICCWICWHSNKLQCFVRATEPKC